MVRVLAPETMKELALVNERPPTDLLASSVTVRKPVPTPNVAVSPAAEGTPPLQLPEVDQLSSEFTFQVAFTPVEGTVINPDALVVAVPITARMFALPDRWAVKTALLLSPAATKSESTTPPDLLTSAQLAGAFDMNELSAARPIA